MFGCLKCWTSLWWVVEKREREKKNKVYCSSIKICFCTVEFIQDLLIHLFSVAISLICDNVRNY